jgi:hypothetical protein
VARKPGRASLAWGLWLTSGLASGSVAASEPPRVVQRVKVYSEPGRFAGWPANHGIWSWGDEILVGFSRGFDKDNGPDYHIDPDRPEDFLLARSKDGACSWSIEEPTGSVVRLDGKVVTVYAFHDRAGPLRDIEATIWAPGSR